MPVALTVARKKEILVLLTPEVLTNDVIDGEVHVWCYWCGTDFEPEIENEEGDYEYMPTVEYAFCPFCKDAKPVFNPYLILGYIPAAFGYTAKTKEPHSTMEFEPDERFAAPRATWRIPFGKHRGEDIEDLPNGYLKWLLGEAWFEEKFSAEREIVEDEIAYRDKWGISK